MSTLPALILLASAYANTYPLAEFSAFQEIRAAHDVCDDIGIDREGTVEYLVQLSKVIPLDVDHYQNSATAADRNAAFHASFDKEEWCGSIRAKLKSYDPAYLKQVGVTD